MDEKYLILAEELVEASKRTYLSGIQTGSGGNVSARIPGKDEMLVKASGSSLFDSTPDGFVLCDLKGRVISGTAKPTREVFLHGLLYQLCPEAMAVVHTHSPYAISWASCHPVLPLTTWHSKLKLKTDLPVLDIPSAMVKEEYAHIVLEVFDHFPKLDGFLLVDHGLVAIGKDPLNAEQTAELIEETAQIAFLKAVMGKLGL